MRAPCGRIGPVASSQLLNSRISAREVSRDLRRSDRWSRQNVLLSLVVAVVAWRTSFIAAKTAGERVGGLARLLPAGQGRVRDPGPRLSHVRLERHLQAEVPGVAAPGKPIDTEVRAVAQYSTAAQRQCERQDEGGVLALEVVVDTGFQVERAQLGERADAAVHTGDPRVTADVPLATHADADDRRHQVLVEAQVGSASIVVLVPAAIEAVVPAGEGLPHRRLAHRADGGERVQRSFGGLGQRGSGTGERNGQREKESWLARTHRESPFGRTGSGKADARRFGLSERGR